MTDQSVQPSILITLHFVFPLIPTIQITDTNKIILIKLQVCMRQYIVTHVFAHYKVECKNFQSVHLSWILNSIQEVIFKGFPGKVILEQDWNIIQVLVVSQGGCRDKKTIISYCKNVIKVLLVVTSQKVQSFLSGIALILSYMCLIFYFQVLQKAQTLRNSWLHHSVHLKSLYM